MLLSHFDRSLLVIGCGYYTFSHYPGELKAQKKKRDENRFNNNISSERTLVFTSRCLNVQTIEILFLSAHACESRGGSEQTAST